MEQGRSNFFSGGLDLLTLGAQQKMSGMGTGLTPPKDPIGTENLGFVDPKNLPKVSLIEENPTDIT